MRRRERIQDKETKHDTESAAMIAMIHLQIAGFLFEVIGWCVCRTVFSSIVFRSLSHILSPA